MNTHAVQPGHRPNPARQPSLPSSVRPNSLAQAAGKKTRYPASWLFNASSSKLQANKHD
jgi:hypothetical protein